MWYMGYMRYVYRWCVYGVCVCVYMVICHDRLCSYLLICFDLFFICFSFVFKIKWNSQSDLLLGLGDPLYLR